MDTSELLRRYVEEHSETAFTELVRGNLDLVYSAALRQVGDATRAQDVTQVVFTDLARKASSLVRHTALTGWLYTSTHYAAAKLRRTEQRRQAREKEAAIMNELLADPAPAAQWERLRPILDEVMHELATREREALLLRFFEQRSYAEVGRHLGLGENAARM
jgi:RNA polymerase sigma factor (sigma-70 family)